MTVAAVTFFYYMLHCCHYYIITPVLSLQHEHSKLLFLHYYICTLTNYISSV